MHISEFDYNLPEELIAQEPLPHRDASRMLVLDRERESWTDDYFSSLPNYLQSGDVLVTNNTRVFPARLFGERQGSGGRVEVLLVREIGSQQWEALIRPGGRLKQGSVILFKGSELVAEVVDQPGQDMRQLRFISRESPDAVWDAIGEVPLPPYIKRPTGNCRSHGRLALYPGDNGAS
jgi:S-adenosylmethionine:tRNA ribosyltransferase-isomerase